MRKVLMNTSYRDLMESSLESLAERTEDLTPPVYERFFKRHPEVQELFVDELGRGRMLNEIMTTLVEIAEGRTYASEAVACLAQDHCAYGDIPLPLYRDFLDAFLETMADILGADWTPEFDAAWKTQTGRLLQM